MKRIYIILTTFFFTLGCGENKVPKNAISLESSSSTYDEFCTQLNRDLSIQFQTLDSLKQLTIYSDSIEICFNKTNEKIFSLLSSMTKDNVFPNCNPNDSRNVSYAISFDKKLALLSWDTRLGGTMLRYTTCAIYKARDKFKVKWLNNFIHDTMTQFSELNYVCYSDIYSITMKNGKTIYLPYGHGLSQTLSPWRTIKAFQISNDIYDLKIFPNEKSELFCDYDFSNLNPDNLPDSIAEIHFYEKDNKLEFPIIKDGRHSGKYKHLIFDGKQFNILSVASP